MKRGSNTNMILADLKKNLPEMKSGKFDFDGMRPEGVISDYEQDIKELES